MVLYSNKYLGIYSLVGKRRSEKGTNLVSKENSSSFWCNTEHRLRHDPEQAANMAERSRNPCSIAFFCFEAFLGGFFPLNLTGILLFEGSFSYDFWLGAPPVEKALGDFANSVNLFNFFSIKMNLFFVSMGGWGKVLFGDSLVYSKGTHSRMPKVGRSQSTISSTRNDETQLGEKRKKKSHWVPPPSAAQFYPFNFIFSSGIPWEIPGGSYSRAVWGSTATGSQSQRQIPRDEEQDLPWPGSLVI